MSDARDVFALDGRVAIVTGGSRGIGRAIARGYARAGARVVVASRKQGGCDAVAAEITDAGGDALAVATHMGDLDAIDGLVERTVAAFGGVDVLVNNAANPLGGPLVDVTPAMFDKSFHVNVRGPMHLGARCRVHLAASGHGSIINVITTGALQPGPNLGLYCASKAALWNLTKVMAKEWAPHVRVNAVAPGPFETAMMAPTFDIPEFRQQIVDSTLLKRIADPEEIVGLALYLAGDASSYITGATFPIDGGLSA